MVIREGLKYPTRPYYNMLDKMRSGLREAVNRVVKSGVVDEDVVIRLKKDVQKCLILSDVDASLVVSITTNLQQKALKENPPPGLSRKDHVIKILYDELSSLLGEEMSLPIKAEGTTRVLMLGIQGSGKTTTCAKLAKTLSDSGYGVGVIGADNYRPGALVQLRTMCQRAGAKVYGNDSESRIESEDIVRDGLAHFGDSVNIILIDTAGRHRNEQDLLKEMGRIRGAAQPDVSLLVIDGTIGQQCRSQAEAFHKTVPVGGIIVTKLDSSANGGGALAAAAATGAHVLYVSNGERVDDLQPFSPTRFVGRLLGMGDIRAVLDLARRLEEGAGEDRNRRIMRGKMTLMDFLNTLDDLKTAGSLKDMLDNIPGLSGKMNDKSLIRAEENTEIWRCMAQSMTQTELDSPAILNRSRIRRIARGSGHREHDIKVMIKNYELSKNMIKSNKGRKMQDLMRRMGLQ